MKTEPQNSADLTQLCKLIKSIPVAMLTTRDEYGILVSRPMSTLEMDAEGALWFFTDRHSAKVYQLETLNLSYADRSDGVYVSVSGRGEISTDYERIEELWTPFARPWFPAGADSKDLALLKVVPDSAEYWDAASSKMVRMLAMAASIVMGKPLVIGEHDTLTKLSALGQMMPSEKLGMAACDPGSVGKTP